MEQLTFSQHVAANGGSLPWQDAVRLTLLTIQTISAQADPETTYLDVCPEACYVLLSWCLLFLLYSM